MWQIPAVPRRNSKEKKTQIAESYRTVSYNRRLRVILKFKFWNPSNPISNNQRAAFPTSGSVIWFDDLGIWQSNQYLLIISYLYCLKQVSKFRQYLKGQVDKWLTLSVKVFSEEISWCSSGIIWKNHKTFEMSKVLHMINMWKWGLLGLTNY